MTSTEALLGVEDLSVSFGGVRAVNGVSFDISAGGATSIIGPNGAGKTTMFNLITGAIRRDSGRVRFNGADITGASPAKVASLGIARTFQDLRIFSGMTVLENVMASFQHQLGESPWAVFLLPGRVRHQERDLREQAMEIIKRVDLKGREYVAAGSLSYAEQKLVVIARAIAMKASVWLLDEPSSGLDTRGVAEVMGTIRNLCADGQTVVIVEHNLSVVREISSRILFLAEGRLIADGTPDEIFNNTELRTVYFGKGNR
jgi:ABC-type branched-subunit amino acid transport system ATPase component